MDEKKQFKKETEVDESKIEKNEVKGLGLTSGERTLNVDVPRAHMFQHRQPIPIVNNGNTCYINAICQLFLNCLPFVMFVTHTHLEQEVVPFFGSAHE